MARARAARGVGVEAQVAELGVIKPPAGGVEGLDPRAPWVGGERGAWAGRLAQDDSVRQDLRRVPPRQNDFSEGKGGGEAEFVGGGVERIPERFNGSGTGLGEHLRGPNRLVEAPLASLEARCLGGQGLAARGRRRSRAVRGGKAGAEPEPAQRHGDREGGEPKEEPVVFRHSAHDRGGTAR